jgi:hypothetical protein
MEGKFERSCPEGIYEPTSFSRYSLCLLSPFSGSAFHEQKSQGYVVFKVATTTPSSAERRFEIDYMELQRHQSAQFPSILEDKAHQPPAPGFNLVLATKLVWVSVTGNVSCEYNAIEIFWGRSHEFHDLHMMLCYYRMACLGHLASICPS